MNVGTKIIWKGQRKSAKKLSLTKYPDGDSNQKYPECNSTILPPHQPAKCPNLLELAVSLLDSLNLVWYQTIQPKNN